VTDNLFRHTAQKHMGQSGTAMGAHHDQIDLVFLCHMDNPLGGVTATTSATQFPRKD